MVDVISCGVPFVTLEGAPVWVDLLNLCKIMRLIRIGRMIRRRVKVPPHYAKIVRVLNLVVMVFMSAHFIGCFWWMLGTTLSNGHRTTSVSEYPGLVDASMWDQYVR